METITTKTVSKEFKRHELDRAEALMESTEDRLYDLFEQVFGEDAAEDMGETAHDIENAFIHELKYCGHDVDSAKVAEIIIRIQQLAEYEHDFAEADHMATEEEPNDFWD